MKFLLPTAVLLTGVLGTEAPVPLVTPSFQLAPAGAQSCQYVQNTPVGTEANKCYPTRFTRTDGTETAYTRVAIQFSALTGTATLCRVVPFPGSDCTGNPQPAVAKDTSLDISQSRSLMVDCSPLSGSAMSPELRG
ncbi:hypothetical protein BJ170DRAFT_728173 [Xylariales sp. AK1849]|nr:hypothetical protein BJ170DRAFT_728173 [Xylariales sp. AK1849]